MTNLINLIGKILIAASLPALASCADTGDFGRRNPSYVTTKFPFDFAPDRIGSHFTLTDDEMELRHRAVYFRNPPRGAEGPSVSAYEDFVSTAFETYYSRLAGRADSSPLARYQRLQADIAHDAALLDPFRQIACRVSRVDRDRQAAYAGGQDQPARFDDLDRAAFATRLAENTALAGEVESAALARFSLYRQSLARLQLSSPDADAAARSGHMLDGLQQILANPPECPL